MKDIKIVLGANFGDEGKGLMTDYFSQSPDTIVVCSNGGAQRGHTVETPDGIRHVFHHFGSGILNSKIERQRAATYLSEDFIVNPIIFKQEYEELCSLGYKPETYIHKNCMVSTPYDMMANQIIEENRGKNKHGSCGLGIYETIKRYEAGVTDLNFSIRNYYLERFVKEDIELSPKWAELFFNDDIYEHFWYDWDFMNLHSIDVRDDYFLNMFKHIIFENAQGLLLDQNNLEYFPNLTPSNTGSTNPKKIIENTKWSEDINIETCYVSRTYMTRHGAGKFPSECSKEHINLSMVDETNVPNPHQNTLRYGTLDLRELYKRCLSDIGDYGDVKSIAITHCNEYGIDQAKLEKLFKGWRIYYSDGKARDSVSARC